MEAEGVQIFIGKEVGHEVLLEVEIQYQPSVGYEDSLFVVTVIEINKEKYFFVKSYKLNTQVWKS